MVTSAALYPWAEGDLEAVVAFLNRADPFDDFVAWNVREAVFDDPDYRPDLLLTLRDGGETIAVGAGAVRGEVGFIKIFAVAAEVRRQGVGTRLLRELEERLAAGGAKTIRFFADTPSFLRPGVDFRNTPFISFLERRGYGVLRAVCNMTVDLAKAPLDTRADEARLVEAGFEIRRLAAADAERFDAYMAGHWSAGWRAEAGRSLKRDPITTHVALRDGEIVGFATHSVSGPGQFGPMGTNPELRGRGVGGVLLRRCLADQRDAGFAECDIQWVGPKGFYADHAGAVISRCLWQYEKTL